MEALTPASPEHLPPIGDLIADEPFWRYPLGAVARQGVTHLRVWLTAGPEPGHLAVVTETGSAAVATVAPGISGPALARRYGPSVVLLEHHPAPQTGEGAGDPQPGPRRRRRQPALAPCLADPGGQSPSRQAGALDGRSRISDRRSARDLVRQVPGPERLTLQCERPPPTAPPPHRRFVPGHGRWRPGWHEWQSRPPQHPVRRRCAAIAPMSSGSDHRAGCGRSRPDHGAARWPA